MSDNLTLKIRDFYEGVHKKTIVSTVEILPPEKRHWAKNLDLLKSYLAKAKRPAELGAGECLLKEVHPRYIGLDISRTALKQAPNCLRIQCDLQALPLRRYSIDMFFSIATLEHIPNPEKVLEELDRVLEPGGVLWFDDAWFCRPWAASGITIKPFSECRGFEKLVKLSIPIRELRFFRALYIIPKRFLRDLYFYFSQKPSKLKWKKLTPNLEEYRVADADACASLDPHEIQLWFKTRGYELENKSGFFSRLFCRGLIIIRKPRTFTKTA